MSMHARPMRGRPYAVRSTALVVTACSLAALAAGIDRSLAQQAPTQLPPVPVDPQAQPKPAVPAAVAQPQASPQPGPKRAAPAPKAAPKQATAAAKSAASAPAAEPSPPNAVTALGSYNPALDLQGVQLPPGTVVTTAGPVQGYRALSTMSSTKTATPIEQIPQTIQVLPKTLLDDQRPTSIGQALKNVSNTQGPSDLGIGNSDMTPNKIRGFGADLWLDGMPVIYGNGNSNAFSNIERVEVLKGPSALLYGGGAGAPIGGAVNLVSKLPTNIASGEVGVTVGSYNYLRTFFDINQPVTPNGTVLFRITGEYSGSKSFVDVLESKRYAINPTLTFTNKEDTTLTVQGSFSKFTQQAYPGMPAVGTVAGPFTLNPWMFPADPTIIPSYTKRDGATITLDHRFDPTWSFNIKARYTKSVNQQDSQGPTTAFPDGPFYGLGPTTWTLLNTELAQTQQEFSINPNVRAKFATGDTKNTILLGADYSRVTDKGFMNTDLGFGAISADLTNPVFPVPYAKPDPLSPFFFSYFNFNGAYTTKGVYAQAQSSIADRVHLVAGARLANVNVNYYERSLYDFSFGFPIQLPPDTFNVDKTKILPRAGAVVDIVSGLAAFASYSEGMRWSAFTQAKSLAPEESRQLEGGLKYKLGQQLSGTVSVYDIARTNVPVVVGVGVTDTATQRSRGFEADMIWQPTGNWKILASYGYTNAYFADDKLAPQGNKLPIVPAHSGRLWVDYAFEEQLKGFSAGIGIYMATSQFVDNANLYQTKGYHTVDSKIAYDAKNWSAALQVKNLTGEKYFTPYSWFGGQVAPGAPREVFGTVTYKY